MTDYHEEVLKKYVTPGLKKNQLTPEAKANHLRSLNTPKKDIEKILSDIYPTGDRDDRCHEVEPSPSSGDRTNCDYLDEGD